MKKKIKISEAQHKMVGIIDEIKNDLASYDKYCGGVTIKINGFFTALTKITIGEILEGVDITEDLDHIESVMGDIDENVDSGHDLIVEKLETLPEDVYYSLGEDIHRECEALKSGVWNKIKSLEQMLGKIDNFSKKMVILYHRDGVKNHLKM